MNATTESIVIIGTGLAGYMLAKEIRKLDPQIDLTLITDGDGAFYSKPLLSTAFSYNRTAKQLAISDADTMADQLNARIITHSPVVNIDIQQQLVEFDPERADQAPLNYTQLVFACGATVKKLPVFEKAAGQIRSVNNLMDYSEFRQWIANKKQIAVLGSGLVGCEFTNDLNSVDYSLDVITMDTYPLQKFVPEAIGVALQHSLAKKNVGWHFEQAVTDISCNDHVTINSQEKTWQADGILSAIGLAPNTDLAKKAGIICDAGIKTNLTLQTSQPNIYALGDCAQINGQVFQYVAPILHSAKILAKTIIGQPATIEFH